MTPDAWAAANRVYPTSAGVPGKRDPFLTPYMVQWARVCASGVSPLAVMVCGAQMGKTDSQLDVMGERLDRRAAPILYVGPSKEFNVDQFEPRLSGMFDEAASLKRKVAGGKRNKKTLKIVAGVRVRLAHAGSSTALKSDPASLALMDEIDEMLANVKGQGDPLGLVQARGFTYADFNIMAASTPSMGIVGTHMDEASGLEFWNRVPPEDLESTIWRLYQEGNMYHWAWPCPECGEYFIPRRKLLKYPEGSSPARASREAYLECPNPRCHAKLYDTDDGATKGRMNAAGLHICRGQWIEDGKVVGEPEDTNTISFWVSGLCSPFVTWGQRAEAIVKAEQGGNPQAVKTAMNAQFGELYAPGNGDLPEWEEVAKCVGDYETDVLPARAAFITAGIDVQGNGLYYVLRAWGPRATSWKLRSGFLRGNTAHQEVWDTLHDLLDERWEGKPVKLAFIDSGFRPGDPKTLPTNKVYDFCRDHARFVFPCKGKDTAVNPLRQSKIEVSASGSASKYGLTLWWLDSDFWKSWVHERVRWDKSQWGAWYLDRKASDDTETLENYARQIVSEARTRGPSGRPVWVKRQRDNHYLDCEALAAAAAYRLDANRLRAPLVEEDQEPSEEADDDAMERQMEEIAAEKVPKPAPRAAPAPAEPAAGDLVSTGNAIADRFARMAAKMRTSQRK